MNHPWTILFSVILLTGCNSDKPFNSQEWQNTGLDGQLTDVREGMVNDLLESDTLMGLTESSVIELLGEPSYTDSTEHCLSFLVREKYGWDIDPEYISYLKVSFDADNRVLGVKVEK